MIISEIFSSIDGESRRAGELATFVRSVGCNLRCSYCDSQYTWHKDASCKEMSVKEIVEECKRLGNHNITFTGGEPLIQKDADELIEALSDAGFDVSIETDGAVDFTERDWFNSRCDTNLISLPKPWICIDYKCPSSGMTNKMISIDKFSKLTEYDVIKFVVGSQEDLNEALKVMKAVRESGCNCWFYLSPVFGKIEPVEIVNFMKDNNLQYKTRFQVQLHKIVWDPNKRGV